MLFRPLESANFLMYGPWKNSSKRKMPWTKSWKKPGQKKGKMRTFVVPRYNNINRKIFVEAYPVWRLVQTRFQISNKKFVIVSMKDISVKLELKYQYIENQNLKISSEFIACGNHILFCMCFASRLVDWMFGSLVAAITFLLFRWLLPFHFTACFNRSFSPWFNCSFFSSQ